MNKVIKALMRPLRAFHECDNPPHQLPSHCKIVKNTKNQGKINKTLRRVKMHNAYMFA